MCMDRLQTRITKLEKRIADVDSPSKFWFGLIQPSLSALQVCIGGGSYCS